MKLYFTIRINISQTLKLLQIPNPYGNSRTSYPSYVFSLPIQSSTVLIHMSARCVSTLTAYY
jgi:hypothetical protein